MSKITVAGDAVVVTSALKLEEIKLLEKFRPEALTLYGGEDGKEPMFVIGTTNSVGTINEFGASFCGETHDDEKLATLTIAAKTDGDIKEFIADAIGGGIISLNKLEEKIPAVLEELKQQKAAVMDSITVLA